MAGISGVGVGIASGGALLIYAGLSGTNPLTALRSIASGSPTAISNSSGTRTATINGGSGGLLGKVPRTGYPPLLQAVTAFDGDHYSQAKRWDPGFSDCSSYVGKGFKSIGVTPPGASTTLEYLAWSMLKKITQFEAGPGDLLISTSHMAVVVDSTHAKGQQNSKRNVQTDTWKNIMAGSVSYGFYRYTPANATVST